MDEVLPNLFLGNLKDAKAAPEDFVKVCVLEFCYSKAGASVPNTVHVPILINTDDSRWYRASEDQLTYAARVIDFYLRDGKKVLVHCAMGIERSPLTVAYYIHLSRNISMDEAYQLVCERHPETARRDGDWLAPYRPLGT